MLAAVSGKLVERCCRLSSRTVSVKVLYCLCPIFLIVLFLSFLPYDVSAIIGFAGSWFHAVARAQERLHYRLGDNYKERREIAKGRRNEKKRKATSSTELMHPG